MIPSGKERFIKQVIPASSVKSIFPIRKTTCKTAGIGRTVTINEIARINGKCGIEAIGYDGLVC